MYFCCFLFTTLLFFNTTTCNNNKEQPNTHIVHRVAGVSSTHHQHDTLLPRLSVLLCLSSTDTTEQRDHLSTTGDDDVSSTHHRLQQCGVSVGGGDDFVSTTNRQRLQGLMLSTQLHASLAASLATVSLVLEKRAVFKQ